MNPALWTALGGAGALLLVLSGVALALLVGGRRPGGRDTVAEARSDVDALRTQVEELSSALAASRGAATVARPQVEYVITTAGESTPDAAGVASVPDRAVLSVTLGEPLVKLAALGFGVRRALSAESRNRIAFQVRREVKRARKERRRAARRSRPAATCPPGTEEAA